MWGHNTSTLSCTRKTAAGTISWCIVFWENIQSFSSVIGILPLHPLCRRNPNGHPTSLRLPAQTSPVCSWEGTGSLISFLEEIVLFNKILSLIFIKTKNPGLLADAKSGCQRESQLARALVAVSCHVCTHGGGLTAHREAISAEWHV